MAGLFQFKVFVVLLFGGQGSSEQQAWFHGVKLTPEFSCHGGEILLVLRAARLDAAFHGILPVNINAVKNSGCFNPRSKMPCNEAIHAGTHESLHVVRLGGAGKSTGLPPTSEGNQYLQLR